MAASAGGPCERKRWSGSWGKCAALTRILSIPRPLDAVIISGGSGSGGGGGGEGWDD